MEGQRESARGDRPVLGVEGCVGGDLFFLMIILPFLEPKFRWLDDAVLLVIIGQLCVFYHRYRMGSWSKDSIIFLRIKNNDWDGVLVVHRTLVHVDAFVDELAPPYFQGIFRIG